MDMDLKPPTRPQPLPTQASASQYPQQTDPFKTDPPVMPQVPSKPKRKGGKAGKTFLMILLVLVLLGGVGYGVYYWQQQNVDKLAKENKALTAQVADTNAKVAELETGAGEEEVVTPTADEQVITVVTNHCIAGVDDATKQALVYAQGTAGTENKKVLYSTDKRFAYVNSSCSATAATATGAARATYLKLVGDEWVFLYSGQATDPISTKLYAIPALTDFK